MAEIKTFIPAIQRFSVVIDDSLLPVLAPLFMIETHMTFKERKQLFWYATGLPENFVACEVGSYLGASTSFIAVAARMRNGHLHCVDDWKNTNMGAEKPQDTWQEFMKNIDPFLEYLCIYRGQSAERAYAVPNVLDMLFIDADHSFVGVSRDLASYAPKLKPGGLLLMHDFHYQEVSDATRQYFGDRQLRDAGRTDSLQAFVV